MTSERRHTFEFSLKIAPSTKFDYYQAITLKIIQVSSFFHPKNDVTHWKQKVAIATYLTKMTLNGVKLEWRNFILLSCGVLDLLGKVPKGTESALPGLDRVNRKVHPKIRLVWDKKNRQKQKSQLQSSNRVEGLFFYNSENHEHSLFKFSRIKMFLTIVIKTNYIVAMATKETTCPSQFGSSNSCYGTCGIKFKHFVMYPGWKPAVPNICVVKIANEISINVGVNGVILLRNVYT